MPSPIFAGCSPTKRLTGCSPAIRQLHGPWTSRERRFSFGYEHPFRIDAFPPEPRVKDWVAAQNVGTLFLSVMSIGELETGFATMRDADRRARLEASLERYLAVLFPGRILPVTRAIATRWGRLDGMRQMAGRPLSAPDGMIAATALEHGLTVVTRNVRDFDEMGVAILNPWTAA